VGMLGQIDSIKPRTLSVLWGELKWLCLGLLRCIAFVLTVYIRCDYEVVRLISENKISLNRCIPMDMTLLKATLGSSRQLTNQQGNKGRWSHTDLGLNLILL
jgi:hypothetical protein